MTFLRCHLFSVKQNTKMSEISKQLNTEVLIIGSGATGTALARDLALRGIQCIIVDKNDVNSGASGANHGLLHSGARYVYSDAEAAIECAEESRILKNIAPHCVEETGGLFVAVKGDSEEYIADFPYLCSKAKVAVDKISTEEARDLEPSLSSEIIAAFHVKDASIDPFKLSLEMLQDACLSGSTYLSKFEVIEFQKGVTIDRVILQNCCTREKISIEAKVIVSAAGVWSADIASLAGINLDMVYSKGTLIITQSRVSSMVINRLRPPSDADIIVPGGTVSVLGTTSVLVENLDNIKPTNIEADIITDECSKLIPSLAKSRFIRAYAGVRPLVGDTTEDSRTVSRGFELIDHQQHGVENFITITGGKLTTCRLMAEKTADMVCKKLGVDRECQTRTIPLNIGEGNKWTEPGLSSYQWLHNQGDMGGMLCDCEMVSTNSISNIVNSLATQGKKPTLKSVGLRSRVGKGSCQGSNCSLRVAGYMYDQGYFEGQTGIRNIRRFIEGRWRGVRPIVSDMTAKQIEMQEAIHSTLFCLEDN